MTLNEQATRAEIIRAQITLLNETLKLAETLPTTETRLGDTYELRPGCEPTPECDSCAHLALAETRAALSTLLNNSAVITKPGEDPCFVDLQCRAPDYEAAYDVLPKSDGEDE